MSHQINIRLGNLIETIHVGSILSLHIAAQEKPPFDVELTILTRFGSIVLSGAEYNGIENINKALLLLSVAAFVPLEELQQMLTEAQSDSFIKREFYSRLTPWQRFRFKGITYDEGKIPRLTK